jgi:hypothetical protein
MFNLVDVYENQRDIEREVFKITWAFLTEIPIL